MSLTLPDMTPAQFNATLQQNFINAVASSALVQATQVAITFASTGRRLLAPGLAVNVTITTASDAAPTVAVSGLNSGLVTTLKSAGFTNPSITSAAVSAFVPAAGSPATTPKLGGAGRAQPGLSTLASLLLATLAAAASGAAASSARRR